MSQHERLFFLGDAEAQKDPQAAGVTILPIPYEETVSWKGGTAKGPDGILAASPYLEFFDEEFQCEPWRWGIWTAPAAPVAGLPPEKMTAVVEEHVGAQLDSGRWLVSLGGEHSITPGAVYAAADRHDGLVVVQFDAHADLRQSYHGSPHNHACAMARCVERVPVRAIGLRSYTQEESVWMAQNPQLHRAAHGWELDSDAALDRVFEDLDGKPVYLTLDVDGLDPSVMPATGTPEPGGLGWQQTISILERLFQIANVVAADVVELAPYPGLHHADFTAAKLVHKCIALKMLSLQR